MLHELKAFSHEGGCGFEPMPQRNNG